MIQPMTTITRPQAIALYDGSIVKLAAALGYSRQAVYLWPEDGPIPTAPYLMLRYQLKPEAFRKDGSLKAAA